ncbi:hypothetical protein CVT25_001537 [Psilocybe cyanescens]|uniref:Uncharacterized protein n=1 Tax=Psilocybe cyanescens TaxID=93625 RepID=A0A409WPX0_PSICY|nr:hypothetical protein CVT25_001537 [Psilocybe cyanescens]
MLYALGGHRSQINRLEISAQTALAAGRIISTIYFFAPSTFTELKTLSVIVEEDPNGYSTIWPQLDLTLHRLLPSFPNLHTMSIPTQFTCIPEIKAYSFSHLHTLIFDGAMEEEEPSMALIVGILHHTPLLETLWLKSISRETSINLAGATIPRTIKTTEDVPIPLSLPRLTCLAITAPGAGSDLLFCIEAPALMDLHLDGSRGPRYHELTGDDFFWSQSDSNCVADSLKRVARKSPELARLALTSVYRDEDTWQWVFFGSETEESNLRNLESLSLWDLGSTSREVTSGFNDDLLFQWPKSSSVLPQKISLRRCTFPITGPALLHAYTSSIRHKVTAPYMVGIDSSCTGITEYHVELLSEAGVVVNICDDDEQSEWWNQGHQIDASDSSVYF